MLCYASIHSIYTYSHFLCSISDSRLTSHVAFNYMLSTTGPLAGAQTETFASMALIANAIRRQDYFRQTTSVLGSSEKHRSYLCNQPTVYTTTTTRTGYLFT